MTAELTEARKAEILAGVPLKRYGSAEEVAGGGGVPRLATPPRYVTGAVLPVDGGLGMGI